MAEVLKIRVTVDGGTYRARVNSSNVIATCTMGAEQAAEAAVAKWNKSGKLATVWTLRLVDQDQGNVSTWFQFEATPVETAGTAEPDEPAGAPNTNGSPTPREGGTGETASAVAPESETPAENPSAEHCTNARALCARGKEPSAMVSAMVVETTLVRRELQVTLPESPDAYGPVIRECLDRERQGGLQAAVLIALQRQQLWPKKQQFTEWMEWAMANLGLARRSCFMYLKVGNLLTSQMVTDLPAELQKKMLACTIPKLEQLARLAAGQLTMVLTKRDPDAMAWDQVKDLVDGMLIPADERKRLKDDAAAREEQRKDPVFQIQSFSEMIERMAGGETLKRKAVIQRIDPGKALVGGVALAMIGVEAEANRKTMSKKDLADAQQYLQKIMGKIEKLREN